MMNAVMRDCYKYMKSSGSNKSTFMKWLAHAETRRKVLFTHGTEAAATGRVLFETNIDKQDNQDG